MSWNSRVPIFRNPFWVQALPGLRNRRLAHSHIRKQFAVGGPVSWMTCVISVGGWRGLSVRFIDVKVLPGLATLPDSATVGATLGRGARMREVVENNSWPGHRHLLQGAPASTPSLVAAGSNGCCGSRWAFHKTLLFLWYSLSQTTVFLINEWLFLFKTVALCWSTATTFCSTLDVHLLLK